MTEQLERNWLRTPDDKVRLVVLKPFTFLTPISRTTADGTERTDARERRFAAGEHVLDPKRAADAVVLEHRWIREDLADGHIEDPAKGRERIAVEEKRDAAEADRRRRLMEEAEAAVRRQVAADVRQIKAGDDFTNDLHTPLNELGNKPKPAARKKKAAAAEGESDEAAENDDEGTTVADDLAANLNTPLNQLPKTS